MIIRKASLSDESQITNLIKGIPGVWQELWRDNVVEIVLCSNEGNVLVAEENDTIIGFASFHDCGFRAYLSELVVAESEQNKGIGRELLKEGERLLSSQGCHLVIGDIFPPAIGFYEKNGWKCPLSALRSKLLNNID
ncbi:GNAT family N-acetyltransferase [Methanolobus sp. WCC1]|jgi:GNAT superfamily N-acetyltransferase|uniref:Putative acetyltransferase n=1 Tax=Methanolobus tindarius DSM 2278 TaxID=1090322 RepID=W9DW47_METTI|nr:GNAT family N-acetyltransferase [Methanolobus tindarius]ETA67646.1 putative acetyltransferase [Methanolobus tindarius DSM 2278]